MNNNKDITNFFMKKMVQAKTQDLFALRGDKMVNEYVNSNLETIKSYFDGDVDAYTKLFIAYLDSHHEMWECDSITILSNLSMCFILDLVPSEDAGEVWLSSYYFKETGYHELSSVIGRNGLIKLAKKYDDTIEEISLDITYKGDVIDFDNFTHIKSAKIVDIRKDIEYAYIVVTRKDGTKKMYHISYEAYESYVRSIPNGRYFHENFPNVMIMYYCLRQWLNSNYIHHNITASIKQAEKYENGVPQSVTRFLSIISQGEKK